MGGSKGQTTSNTNQTQSYTPAGGSYIQNALNRAGQAANQPFSIPQAPVAGFSQDQLSAFQNVNNAQGMTQPYINQAQSYFGPGGAQQFYNPMAANVTANLNDIFGQQQAQTTGQLTQAAGGVGADRIAVGQANLAKEQGLAAGQTYSQLWNNAVQQAQGAGYGTAALGSQAQNAALQGAQAQLGTGGLQQQLSQAQLNSPYQQQLAQAAFPYQQAQFLAGITGSLAPGLGGTTTGQGNTQTNPAQPSIWSQILGGGTAAAGIYGGLSGGGGKGSGMNPFGSSPSYGGGNMWSGDAYGGSANNPLQGLNASDYGYAEGGAAGDEPIDIAPQSIIPEVKTPSIQPQVPQLNLSPPQQQQSGGGGGGGGGIGDIVKLAAMFMARGGAARGPYNFHEHRFPQGYADGGASFDERWSGDFEKREPSPQPQQQGNSSNGNLFYGMAKTVDRMRKERGYADGGDVLDLEDRFAPVRDALTAGDFDAMGRNSTTFEPFKPASRELPSIIARGATGAAPVRQAMQFAPEADADAAAPENAPVPAAASPAATRTTQKDDSFINSPWAALTAAGLGIMGGTSPFAGVNIGQGGLQGLKTLEQQRAASQKDTTIQQAADRLDQEARFHEDQYKRMTPYQQQTLERQKGQDELAQQRFNRPYEQLTKQEQALLDESKRQHDLARVPQGFRQKDDGTLEPIAGGPHSPEQIRSEADAKRLPAMADEDLRPLIDTYKAGNTMGVLASISRGTQGPQNVQRFWHLLAEDLTREGATGKDLAAAKANFMAQSAGARVAAQRESNIETAVNEAKGTFPEVLRTSALLPRSNWTPINAALEYARTKSGSPEQRQFGAAIQAAITAYSQAMSRTGANSVYAQQHAADVLSKTDGPQALKASIDQLNIEMGIAQRAPEETRQAILHRILGIKGDAQAAGAGAPAAPAKAMSPEDQQAIDWANANPSDPRAAAIKKRLGAQ